LPEQESLKSLPFSGATELPLKQWQLLEPLIPKAKSTGQPQTVDLMRVMQGILYVLASGCAWRLLPKDYPPYSTVHYIFASGETMALGKRSMTLCTRKFVALRIDCRLQVLQAWIHKPFPVRSWCMKQSATIQTHQGAQALHLG
jgi:transposase